MEGGYGRGIPGVVPVGMASMLVLIVGLLSFLREVQIAIRSLHIGLPASVPPPPINSA